MLKSKKRLLKDLKINVSDYTKKRNIQANCDKNICSKCKMSNFWEENPDVEKMLKELGGVPVLEGF